MWRARFRTNENRCGLLGRLNGEYFKPLCLFVNGAGKNIRHRQALCRRSSSYPQSSQRDAWWRNIETNMASIADFASRRAIGERYRSEARSSSTRIFIDQTSGAVCEASRRLRTPTDLRKPPERLARLRREQFRIPPVSLLYRCDLVRRYRPCPTDSIVFYPIVRLAGETPIADGRSEGDGSDALDEVPLCRIERSDYFEAATAAA